MSTITVELDGQTLVVDLARVTLWDAISFDAVGLGSLELTLAALAASEAPVLGSGLAVVAWLWWRQNGQPNVSLEAVARRLPLFSAPDAPKGAPVVDAPDGSAPVGAVV